MHTTLFHRAHWQFCRTLSTQPDIEALLRKDHVTAVTVLHRDAPSLASSSSDSGLGPGRDSETSSSGPSASRDRVLFEVSLASGAVLYAERVVLATGSLNHPVVPKWLQLEDHSPESNFKLPP
jgi:hypothetical protein